MATKKTATDKGAEKLAESAAEKTGTQVVLSEQAALAAASSSFEGFASAGLENVGVKDLLVPRLTILQPLSPQINPKKGEYIEGAKAGVICDVGTGELFPDGVLFLPVFYRKDYLEWAPRSTGKGLVNIHSDPMILEQATQDENRRYFLPNGNYIAETAQFFGFNLSADARMCFIPMASTQLKKARKWLTLATGEKLTRGDGSKYTPPLFYRSYALTSVAESNNDGDWDGWKIDRHLALPELDKATFGNWQALLAQSGKIRDQLLSGAMKADNSFLEEHSEEAALASSTEARM